MQRYDVAIVGGGMVGASLALALAPTRLSLLVIEGTSPDSTAQPSFDERTTALGNASRRIFEALGVWPRIGTQAAAIRIIHVSDAGRFGFARLCAAEQGVDAFGFVAANRVIGAALWEAVRTRSARIDVRVPAQVTHIEPCGDAVRLTLASAAGSEELEAALVVAADGAQSRVRQAAAIDAEVKDYQQLAIVANVAADRPHEHTAYERFTPSGPLAVLPLVDGSYTVVWARSPHDAEQALALPDERFLASLQEHFGWRAGRFVRLGKRGAYPLSLTWAKESIGPRTVLVGNAAQALHPVAGQGFNLGLRDAAVLAEVLAEAQEDPGSAAVLERFASRRQADRRGIIAFTDGLIRLFANPRQPVGWARDLGLLLFDLTPAAKSALARVSSGFGGQTPRLARGLSLSSPFPGREPRQPAA